MIANPVRSTLLDAIARHPVASPEDIAADVAREILEGRLELCGTFRGTDPADFDDERDSR